MVQTASGIRRFVYGFAKKILLANVLGLCADRLYGLDIENTTSLMVLIASVAYALQIYYDFSGYSDMAIGLGKIFGFAFKENFYYPYRSKSIREFWRRWHISLSSWFRDYVYIPLGGNRKGTIRTYLNLFIVFFCTGIWHGANWAFVFWGMYHGVFCVIERIGLSRLLHKSRVLTFFYCITVVNFGWIFFRVENIKQSFSYIYRILVPWKFVHSSYSVWELIDVHMLVMIGIGIMGSGILKYIGEKTGLEDKWKYSVPEMVYCGVIFLLSIMSLASNTYNPFIYFRF